MANGSRGNTKSVTPPTPPSGSERRDEQRGRLHLASDLLYKGLRLSTDRIQSFRTAVGVFLIAGGLVAIAGTWAFAIMAQYVEKGATQAFDERVMAYMGAHRVAWIERSLIEITALGTGLVVIVLVAVAATFLWLTRHKYSAALLLTSTIGGLILNNILKLMFDRERPQMFEWLAHASSSSFPSGHAMSSAIVYATIGYLAARLQRRRWARWLTLLLAFCMIVLICVSRLYLGVHYPSDVAAGLVLGLAWAAFCMAALEAIQVIGRRRSAQMAQDEEPAPPKDTDAPATTAPVASQSDPEKVAI